MGGSAARRVPRARCGSAHASGREQAGLPVELDVVGDAEAALTRLASCPYAALVVLRRRGP